MRKVVLTMYEDYQYQNVKRCVDQNGNFKRLCCQLHCSERTGRRKIAGYKLYGKAFFQHKNHFHKPASAIPESVRAEILQIYNADFYDANFTHFHELLRQSHPHIQVSLSFLRNLFKSEDILSPKARRKTVRALKKKQASHTDPDAESPSLQIQTPYRGCSSSSQTCAFQVCRRDRIPRCFSSSLVCRHHYQSSCRH